MLFGILFFIDILFAMKSFHFFLSVPLITAFFFGITCFFEEIPTASAASVTVCNTSCDYTTIRDAILNEVFGPGQALNILVNQ